MINPENQKKKTEDDLRWEFESTISDRINRYLEIGHHWIVADHYFASASSECIKVYRDGHFVAAAMMSHALNEAIITFVAEKNLLELSKTIDKLIVDLEKIGKISAATADASMKIYKSYRNDIHHLSPVIATIDFRDIASQNLKRLALIEREIFGVRIKDGGVLQPINPEYWSTKPSGYVSAYIRLE